MSSRISGLAPSEYTKSESRVSEFKAVKFGMDEYRKGSNLGIDDSLSKIDEYGE